MKQVRCKYGLSVIIRQSNSIYGTLQSIIHSLFELLNFFQTLKPNCCSGNGITLSSPFLKKSAPLWRHVEYERPLFWTPFILVEQKRSPSLSWSKNTQVPVRFSFLWLNQFNARIGSQKTLKWVIYIVKLLSMQFWQRFSFTPAINAFI